MKNTLLTNTLLTLGLLLTACGGTASEQNSTQTDENQRAFSMSTEMVLMVGTVKLDETEYAIDSKQAMELLPLWKALQSLSESETAATAEIEALTNQIEDTMTREQMDAITAMELSMDDMRAVQEQLGIESSFSNITPEIQATMQAARESGQMPPSGGLGGGMIGGMQGGGVEMDPSARETTMAERKVAGGSMRLNTALLDGIITFLESK